MFPNDRILSRTFFIKGEQYGSAFTLDVDGNEYLVTARHLLDEAKDEFDLRLFRNGSWETVRAQVVGHGRGELDVSVLRLPERLTSDGKPVIPTLAGLVLGQDAFFLGFPYKAWSNVGELLGGMPCAFVKKGTISAIQFEDPQVIHLDAINNEGFSGGPVFFYSPQRPREGRVAGVVSKYRVEFAQVLDAKGEETGMTVAYNAGFLVAYGIGHVLDIIRQSAKPS